MKTKFYSTMLLLLIVFVTGLAVATSVLPYDALLSVSPPSLVSPAPPFPTD